MLTLCSLYIYELLKFVKINVTEFNTLNYFHEYNTRHGDHIAYKNHNLTKYESNPYYVGAVLYNNVCKDKRDIKSVKKFSVEIRKILVKQAFYSIDEYLNFCM